MNAYRAAYFSSSTQTTYPFTFESPKPMPQTNQELIELGEDFIAYVKTFGCSTDFPLMITANLPDDEFEQLLLDTHYYPANTFFLTLALQSHQKIVHAESGAFYDLLGANHQMLLYREKNHTTFDVVNPYEASGLFLPIFTPSHITH